MMSNAEQLKAMGIVHNAIEINKDHHSLISADETSRIIDRVAHKPIKFISCTTAQMHEMEDADDGTLVYNADTQKVYLKSDNKFTFLYNPAEEEEEDIHHNMNDRKIKTRCDRCGGSLNITDHSLETGLAKCPYCRSLLYIYV